MEISVTNIVTILSIIGSAIIGWIVWEFVAINKQHDNLSKNIQQYIQRNDKNITEIEVNIGKIQTSLEHIEDMIKYE